MKEEEIKHPEKKLGNTKQQEENPTVRKKIEPLEKQEVRDEDKRMNGDVLESHLGIDE